MIRVILVNLLFLLLPSLLYFAYVYYRRRENPNEPIRGDAPIFWLITAGVVMMMISIVLFGHWHGGEPGKRYVPPQFKDGVVIPGHVE